MMPLALACLWLIAANLIAMLPSRDQHLRAAYGLISIGIPLLGWVTWDQGPLLGLAFLTGGVSVLRWPVLLFWRRLGRAHRTPAE